MTRFFTGVKRIITELAYESQRRVDHPQRIDRDQAYWQLIQKRCRDDFELQAIHQHELIDAQARATHFERHVLATAIAKELMEFAIFIATQREQTMYYRGSDSLSFLPTDAWEEYKYKLVRCGDATTTMTSVEQFRLEQYFKRYRQQRQSTVSTQIVDS